MFCAFGIMSAGATTVTQEFKTGLGFPEGTTATVPTEATTAKASDTGIEYTLLGTNVNTGGYLMISGKTVAGAYISWSLDFDCVQLALTTTSGGSTNANNTVNIYANDNVIVSNFAVNTQSQTYIVDIPAEYQKAGTVYKVESNTTGYNTQFSSFTYSDEKIEAEEPDAPEGTITVAEALVYIENGYRGEATVKGIISQIDEISTQYGNATYVIKDALTDENGLKVYRGFYLNGEKFTAEDQLAVGGIVTVEGKLTLYGSTPEFDSGNTILSYEAPQGGGDQPGTGDDDPVTPPTPEGNQVTFDFTKDAYGLPNDNDTYTTNGTVIKSGSVNIELNGEEDDAWRMWTDGLRAYNKKFPYFTVTEANGYKVTEVSLTVVSGATFMVEGYENDANITTWVGSAESVTFTYTATSNKAVKTITVKYDDTTAVDTLGNENVNAPVEYFNLQGVRVANPEAGNLYIVRQGNKVSKTLVR